jgi:zinc D-Ala-D-Ala carboxypeptidase
MSRHHPLRRTAAAAVAALIGVAVLGCTPTTSTSSADSSPMVLPHRDSHNAMAPSLQKQDARALSAADGEVTGPTTVFSKLPAVANLDPALRTALRAAATDAARNGVELDVNSGWRSRAYQERLFREAVRTYGSAAKAERWVARPGTSVHEAGDAVDLGPSSADAWLARYGAAFGLCQVYGNEPWHFELRPDARSSGCPATYPDPTHDPRMQR